MHRSIFGRKAYGHQRHMTEADKARNIARSIVGKVAQGREWSFADYGLENNPQQQERVKLALRHPTGKAGDP
jgi:hypothetical protein